MTQPDYVAAGTRRFSRNHNHRDADMRLTEGAVSAAECVLAERPGYFQATAVAARTGVSLATLRAYALEGLIRPLRTASRVRLFTAANRDRVREIYRARRERHGTTGSRPAAPKAL